jgi:phosphoglycerate dehydrogenase-like enzyme
MMRIAFIGPLAGSFAEAVRAKLDIPCEIVLSDETNIPSKIPDVDVVVTLVFTREMGERSARLRLVQVPGAGLDRIDRTAIPPNAFLANVYGHETGIAEYIFGAMLALSRAFSTLDDALRRGDWLSQWGVGLPTPPPWPELAGKTLGILGYGRIGQALAKRAAAFDMKILAMRRDLTHADSYAVVRPPESLDEILAASDFLAITVPLTPSTKGLIGAPQLALMKPTAILVNVARAALIDEEALYSALSEKRIGGAALDVWYNYPSAPGQTRPSTCPFHELPNVLMTPHIAGWTDGVLEARAVLMAENITRVSKGLDPLNIISV